MRAGHATGPDGPYRQARRLRAVAQMPRAKSRTSERQRVLERGLALRATCRTGIAREAGVAVRVARRRDARATPSAPSGRRWLTGGPTAGDLRQTAPVADLEASRDERERGAMVTRASPAGDWSPSAAACGLRRRRRSKCGRGQARDAPAPRHWRAASSERSEHPARSIATRAGAGSRTSASPPSRRCSGVHERQLALERELAVAPRVGAARAGTRRRSRRRSASRASPPIAS